MAQPKQTVGMALEHFKQRIYAEIAATRMGNFRAQDARCLALIARVGQAVNEFEGQLKAGGVLPVRPVSLSRHPDRKFLVVPREVADNGGVKIEKRNLIAGAGVVPRHSLSSQTSGASSQVSGKGWT